MKIGVLYEVWGETESYPGAKDDADDTARPRRRKRPKLDREEVFDALTKLGHEASYIELDGRDATLFALAKSKVDLVFNLVESYAGDDSKDMNVPAFMDLVGVHYTGSGPQGLLLAQDKALAKKIVEFHGLKTPFSAVSHRGRLDYSHDVKFPLIVKPVSEDGSIGIDVGSVVDSVKELMERIHHLHEELDVPILIEEYIEGREIYAAIIGNRPPEALPLVELDLSTRWSRDLEEWLSIGDPLSSVLAVENGSVSFSKTVSKLQACKSRVTAQKRFGFSVTSYIPYRR